MERLARYAETLEAEISAADEWEKTNPPPQLPPPVVISIRMPGLPTMTMRVRRCGGSVIVRGRITSAKQLGRDLGRLLDQFMP